MESVNSSENSNKDSGPRNHRTVDRITQIIEEVVYSPGLSLAELVRALNAPKSTVYGFVQGLLARGWLYEEGNRYYLGPAVYGLTLAGGRVKASTITSDDIENLHKRTGVAVYLGVLAGDHLIYVAEAGTDHVEGFAARSNIRRSLLKTAAGKALLAEKPAAERVAFLRRQEQAPDLVEQFLNELETIQTSHIAINRLDTRLAIATTIKNVNGEAVASITMVGPANALEGRVEDLSNTLLEATEHWSRRTSR